MIRFIKGEIQGFCKHQRYYDQWGIDTVRRTIGRIEANTTWYTSLKKTSPSAI